MRGEIQYHFVVDGSYISETGVANRKFWAGEVEAKGKRETSSSNIRYKPHILHQLSIVTALCIP